MIGLGLRLTYVAGVHFAVPTGLAGTITAGAADGEVVIDVTDIPGAGEWGDATVVGDAAGTAGIIQWWSPLEGWQTLSDPAATGEESVFVSPGHWGTDTTIRIRALSAQGRASRSISATISIAGALHELALIGDADDTTLYEDGAGSVYYYWKEVA